MLEFTTSRKVGYRQRTWDNAGAEVTIAFAYDFGSAGEKLTKKSVLAQKRTYIPIPLSEFGTRFHFMVDRTVDKLNTFTQPFVINVAGNGIYTMREYNSDQDLIDNAIYKFLKTVIKHPNAHFRVAQIRSGGQTGADEAGIKAAIRLGIPALVHAPHDWVFRGLDGKDISSETHFKARFDIL